MSSNDVQIFSRFFTFLNPYNLLRSLVVDRSDWSLSETDEVILFDGNVLSEDDSIQVYIFLSTK